MTKAVPPLKGAHPENKEQSLIPSNLDWMPVSRYRPFWPKMDAFALPAFYDGRVRINLVGRESRGTVPLGRYMSVRDEIIELVGGCRGIPNGGQVVEDVHFEHKDPHSLNPTEADIYFFWRGMPAGFIHPTLGQIGPIPYFRTGGHTGESGFLYMSGKKIPLKKAGRASSFDVVPTIIDLLGEPELEEVTGKSLKPQVTYH
jgi:predicted AlkP superfamily phosphohydrolase/phosphomutase